MHDAARKLASYGRHGDNMLLHVSRKELEGIRALTGRDFTRNPDTGLPEAFNFSSLIPIAAGIAGTVLSGGNVGIGALASGAASAATTAAQGGSAQDALTQGLISGATSFAGGQLMSGVGLPVGEAAGAAGASVPGSVAGPSLVPGGITGELLSPLPGVAESASGYNAIAPMTGAAPSPTPVSVPPMASTTGIAGPAGDPGFMGQTALPVQPAAPTAPGLGDTMAARASGFGERLSNIVSDPSRAISQIGSNIRANPYYAAIAGGGALLQANDMFGDRPSVPGEPEYDPNRYPERFPANPRRWNAPPAGYRPGTSPEYRYFAEGGLASLRKEDGYTANLMNEAKAALLGEHPRPREAIMRFREAFGDDALDLLRDRISGGRVRGAGGGMDDLVPGTIEGRQKVRLADGEFVIPADVVSGLGDGSTDQGVRKLHGLMNKVRQQRTGKKAQPKAIGGKITL